METSYSRLQVRSYYRWVCVLLEFCLYDVAKFGWGTLPAMWQRWMLVSLYIWLWFRPWYTRRMVRVASRTQMKMSLQDVHCYTSKFVSSPVDRCVTFDRAEEQMWVERNKRETMCTTHWCPECFSGGHPFQRLLRSPHLTAILNDECLV